jgi:hypothetical protein
LNLGLRYELAMPWYEPHNLWGTFVPGQQSTVYPNAPRNLVFPGDAGIPPALVPTDWNNVAPRFGFAWDVLGTGRTAVRGGYGIYYDQLDANLIQNTGQPFRYAYTITAPYSLTNPLLGGPAIPATVNLTNPTFVAPTRSFIPIQICAHPICSSSISTCSSRCGTICWWMWDTSAGSGTSC